MSGVWWPRGQTVGWCFGQTITSAVSSSLMPCHGLSSVYTPDGLSWICYFLLIWCRIPWLPKVNKPLCVESHAASILSTLSFQQTLSSHPHHWQYTGYCRWFCVTLLFGAFSGPCIRSLGAGLRSPFGNLFTPLCLSHCAEQFCSSVTFEKQRQFMERYGLPSIPLVVNSLHR